MSDEGVALCYSIFLHTTNVVISVFVENVLYIVFNMFIYVVRSLSL